MAQRFKAKTLLSNSGVFNNEVIAPNLVYNTGNQNISGQKRFTDQDIVSTVTFNSPNQPSTFIGGFSGPGVFRFEVKPEYRPVVFPNPNYFYTGVNVGQPVEIYFNTGTSRWWYTVNNSFVDASPIVQASSLSAPLPLNNWSGGNMRIYPTYSHNTSHHANGNDAINPILIDAIATTGGNQTISGVKTFATGVIISGDLQVSGTGIFNAIDLNSIDNLSLSGVDITITSGIVTLTNAPILSGNPLITGNLSLYATTSNLALTGSTLQTNINNLSGTSVQTFGNQTISGTKIFAGSLGLGNINNPNSNKLYFYDTGTATYNTIQTYSDAFSSYTIFELSDQGSTSKISIDLVSKTISGANNSAINFSNRPTANGTGVLLSGEAASLPTTIVYTTGNQTISGIKSFATGIDVINSGNPQNLRVFNRTGLNTGEFGIFGWNNDQLTIGAQQTNSGILRDVLLTGANININSSGVLNIFDPVNITGNVTITGHLSASSKSFLIDHPTQLGKKLQYGSLEGPEHGVFVRGKTSDTTINLPNYWASLVDENSISVNLTPIDIFSNIYVVDYNNIRIIIDGNNGNDYFYTVYGERKDIPKLTVEF